MRASLAQPDRRDRQILDPTVDLQAEDTTDETWPEPSADQRPDGWAQRSREPSVSDDDLANWFG